MSVPTPNTQRSTNKSNPLTPTLRHPDTPPQPSRPISQARLEANRANAQKSTGPRTPEGKARSSRNAITHGLLARYVIPANDPVEDPAEFELLIDALVDQFRPRDCFEQLCISPEQPPASS